MTTLALKIGDTFIADCIYKDNLGVPLNLTTAGITITSAVVNRETDARAALIVTVKDQAVTPGGYRIVGDTTKWGNPGMILWDIRYSQDGQSFSTETLSFPLGKRIT